MWVNNEMKRDRKSPLPFLVYLYLHSKPRGEREMKISAIVCCRGHHGKEISQKQAELEIGTLYLDLPLEKGREEKGS